MKRALLIVDLQNDFLPGGSLAVRDGHHIIAKINTLQKLPFDLIIATKDWHPKNHRSFASIQNKKPGETIDLSGHEQILWPDHCIQYSFGSEFPQGLQTGKINKIIYKGIDENIDSYSAFFDNHRLHQTELDNYLKNNEIFEIVIVGLATDYCVKYTALDAVDLGYTVIVVADACRGVNLKPNDESEAFQEMSDLGVKIQNSKEIEDLFVY